MIDFEKRKNITALLEIAAEASQAVLEVYRSEDSVETVIKEDDSPLTRADRVSNTILCKGLQKLAPEIPIISEEQKQVAYDVRKNYEFCWLLDPLDGTKEFIKKNDEFTIHIALLRGAEVVASVVAVPAQNQYYWAVRGKGAYFLQENSEILMEVAPFTFDQEALRVVCSRSHLDSTTSELLTKLNNPVRVSVGSSLKFLQIAAGNADFYPRLAPTMEWDTGAPQLILEEAGGHILRLPDFKPLVYNKQKLLNPSFIAYGGANEPFPKELLSPTLV